MGLIISEDEEGVVRTDARGVRLLDPPLWGTAVDKDSVGAMLS